MNNKVATAIAAKIEKENFTCVEKIQLLLAQVTPLLMRAVLIQLATILRQVLT